MKLVLPENLAARVWDETKAGLPHECCGLIEGLRAPDAFLATALHPCRNLSSAPDRFEIDPADHLSAARAARARGRALIGCYHSHPGGKAQPSLRDLAGAGEENFIWLIAAPEGLGAFVYCAGGFAGLSLVTGADFVMSSP